MWVIFDKIEFQEDITSKKSGKTYSGWVATGTKKGYDGAPDEPWSKVFFDNQTTTIIEGGLSNHNQSIVQYLLKGAKPGDTLNIRMERDGGFWRIVSMENITNVKPDYTPLAEQITNSASAVIPTTNTSSTDGTQLPW